MRDVDLELLRRPYPQPVEGAESPAYRAALGVDVPFALKLRDAIYNDLDQAKAEAKRVNKPLFVIFRCVPTKIGAAFDHAVARTNSSR